MVGMQNGVCAGASTAPGSEEKVAKLVALGYSQKNATLALTRCQNDIAAAKDYLMGKEILGRR
jgi:Holliday junction resolvasome RuvABC DNA-binding subunit